MPSPNLPASIACGFRVSIVAMSLLAVEPARCHSQQPANAPTAVVALEENPLAAEFKVYDANGDGALTEGEYLKRADGRCRFCFANSKSSTSTAMVG